MGKIIQFVLAVLFISWTEAQNESYVNSSNLKIWLTIRAQERNLEVFWTNAPAHKGDQVLVTKEDAVSFEKNREGDLWVANGGATIVVATIRLSQHHSTHWHTTDLHYDYRMSGNVTINTSCYGFWASYIDAQAFPHWMNDLKTEIGNLTMRDLFIPGTHHSGSYDPWIKETQVTKYSLNQDEDIMGQLMHGVRYLDIHMGYFAIVPEPFFTYHGIVRMHPLQEIINHVRNFVRETNEIVIFAVTEFPYGFLDRDRIHRRLVNILREEFKDLLVSPSLTWGATLNEIWDRNQNIILAYDHDVMLAEFPGVLFNPVQQRWGNKQSWADLKEYLRDVNEIEKKQLRNENSLASPVSVMAELTILNGIDIFFNTADGLRKLADDVNSGVSQLYQKELGSSANIVAADFIRGTTLIEVAIEYNKQPRKKLF